MPERKYRDPVHNIISLDSDKRDDFLLISLIDTAEFQRLRRIKQLGLALYTYQGAEHSRFTHSLGVMHIMTRVLDKLASENNISEETRIAARAAALLHDIGHGPFSHVIEKATNIKHEDWTEKILTDKATEVNSILSDFDIALPEMLVDIYRHKADAIYASQLVSSQLDCDRFDYLLRDSLMTGAKYGNYDLEWIIHTLKLDPISQKIYVSSKGLYAVEEYLQARFYMFRQVYFHHSLRAVENMLISILRRAVDLLQENRLQFVIEGNGLVKLLGKEPLTTDQFLALDDHDVMFHIKQWMREKDPILRDLCKRFINRRLFKSIDIKPDDHVAEFIVEAKRIVEEAGFDSNYYLLRDSAADIPYFGPYTLETSKPQSRIYIEVKPPQGMGLHEITEVSQVVRGMRGFQIDRLCFPKEVSQKMYKLLSNWPESS
ncbi:MAG: HD domain-containing protein [Blastocatellia bacterium]|nr:HD domain-containing protein [Blastocatellia bacterium]